MGGSRLGREELMVEVLVWAGEWGSGGERMGEFASKFVICV